MTLEILRNFVSHFHPAFVHFPIGLISAGAAMEGWSTITRRGVSSTGRIMLLFGFLGAGAAVATGLLMFHPGDFSGTTLAVARIHRLLGLGAGALALAAALTSGVQVTAPLAGKRLWVYRLTLVGAAFLVGMAGHYGGWIVHGWGKIWAG